MPTPAQTLLSLPNLLTIGRIVIVPLLIASFYLPAQLSYWVALALFLIASATDFLDGMIARRREQVSEFGRFLDPIADKILVAAALVMLAVSGGLENFSVIAAIIILCREFIVSGLREFLAGAVVIPVTSLAKWKTAIQMTAIAILLIAPALEPDLPARLLGEITLWFAALLTIVTGAAYLKAGAVYIRRADKP
jgi:CDP-diacylglycerol---glycerol-3-phosphate 3-phosphatidyltransferase